MRVCVFCSSKSDFPQETFDQATLFCQRLAKNKIGFVYGGGKLGMMGHMANAMLAAKGEAIGVMPEGLFPHEVAHSGLTELIYTADLMERKRKMMELSDAFVIFPGGVGTLDEALEVITWKTIQRFKKPIVFFNWQGYWDPFWDMMKAYEAKNVFYPETMASFILVDDVDTLIKELSIISEGGHHD